MLLPWFWLRKPPAWKGMVHGKGPLLGMGSLLHTHSQSFSSGSGDSCIMICRSQMGPLRAWSYRLAFLSLPPLTEKGSLPLLGTADDFSLSLFLFLFPPSLLSLLQRQSITLTVLHTRPKGSWMQLSLLVDLAIKGCCRAK